MAIDWTESKIEEVVSAVLKSLGRQNASSASWDSTQYNGRAFIGVYADMNDAIDAASAGYKAVRAMSVAEREKIITAIRNLCREEAPVMARLGVAETKMGRVDHKTAKHILVADKTPGTEDIQASAQTGDYGLTLTEMAPFGVVGSITPSTNPSETVICNSIGMIAAGNGVVFNPHPNAIATSNYAVDLVNRACAAAGGPKVLVASTAKPTLESAQIMYQHPAVRMLVCTGGPGVVKSVLSSGKKAIGAGAGNPPVIVDDTADVRKAGKDIIDGCSFDNNLPCIAEKEVFAFANIADELISSMKENGAYEIDLEQANRLAEIVLVESKNPKTGIVKKVVSRDCVGRDAKVLLEKIGVRVGDEVRCIICETSFEHPFDAYSAYRARARYRSGDRSCGQSRTRLPPYGAHAFQKYRPSHAVRARRRNDHFRQERAFVRWHRLRRGRAHHLHDRRSDGRGADERKELYAPPPLRHVR